MHPRTVQVLCSFMSSVAISWNILELNLYILDLDFSLMIKWCSLQSQMIALSKYTHLQCNGVKSASVCRL